MQEHTIPASVLAQLPGLLAQVARAAGVKAAWQLAQARGGGRAYIPAPQGLHEKHWLPQVVGLEAAQAIAQALGGGEVEVPLGPFAGNRAQVWAAIERGLNAGLSVEQAARQVGVTARTVRRHKSGETGGRKRSNTGYRWSRFTLPACLNYRMRLEVSGRDLSCGMVMDKLTPLARSRNMSLIRSKGTKPEMAVRSLLHRLGFRFRLHRKDLPGTPDITLPKFRMAIFVHGCFWHQHKDCALAVLPKSNISFWQCKFQKNVVRDNRAQLELMRLGWDVLIIWECELKNMKQFEARLLDSLGAVHASD